jgi:rhodanese-related sulfurtransferase
VKNLTQTDLSAKLQEENTVLIDVRTPGEVANGYIPSTALFADISGDNFNKKINELDSTKTYVVYCKSGGRSTKAANYMVQKGFINVYNLEGGISNYTGELAK